MHKKLIYKIDKTFVLYLLIRRLNKEAGLCNTVVNPGLMVQLSLGTIQLSLPCSQKC